MPWLAIIQATLPDHCRPENDLLLRLSSAFGTCIPTPLALISSTLGFLSIIAWLFAQLPQIYKNWTISSTSGLSIFFLVEWCLGDVSNLLGALFTHQASWQVAIGAYYVFVDLCLVGQWIWYEQWRHGHSVFRVRKSSDEPGRDSGDGHNPNMERVVIEGPPPLGSINTGGQSNTPDKAKSKDQTRPRIIFRAPTFQERRREEEKNSPNSGTLSATPSSTKIHNVGGSSPMPSPSPRTILMIACLIAVVSGSPVQPSIQLDREQVHGVANKLTTLELVGTVLAWISSVLYLGSRLPQLFKNWQRKSTAGLSPHLFIAAFCGNLFYSSALITNPNAWNDYAPYGGGGWADRDGNDRAQWIVAALPFFLGAAGVLGLDASVGVQFLLYGENTEKIVAIDAGNSNAPNPERRWRRVSGWMRGWMPSISAGKGTERDALLERTADEQPRESYGTVS